jgi:hypothetical protein
MLIEPDHDSPEPTPAQQIRAPRFDATDDRLPADEREIQWIAAREREQLNDFRTFLMDVPELSSSDVEDFLDWNGREWSERGSRMDLITTRKNLQAAQQAYEQLWKAFDSDVSLTWKLPPRDDGTIERDAAIVEAFRTLQSRIEDRSRDLEKMPAGGNYKTNRGAAIVDYWPALRDAGYTMRAASRILAQAFARAGLEDGPEDQRANSIYSVIRNAAR